MPYLHWLTREQDLRRSAKAPFRLLEYDPALSAGDRAQQNMSYHGYKFEATVAMLVSMPAGLNESLLSGQTTPEGMLIVTAITWGMRRNALRCNYGII